MLPHTLPVLYGAHLRRKEFLVYGPGALTASGSAPPARGVYAHRRAWPCRSSRPARVACPRREAGQEAAPLLQLLQQLHLQLLSYSLLRRL
eukprot:scaffold120907_cov60-Phaeocystis_antarctica.AAC.2